MLLLPASSGQRQIWTHEQLRPGDPLYSVPMAIDLTGPVDVPALRAAVNDLVVAHPSLRSTLMADGDQLVQVVSPASSVEIEVTDVDEEETALAEAGFAARPLDDGHPRWSLLRVREDHHVLLVSISHAFCDGTSSVLLNAGLQDRYAARLSSRGLGDEPALCPTDDETLAARAARQTEEDDERGRADLAWWTNRLADAPEVQELPLDRPRPVRSVHAARSVVHQAGLRAPVRSLARSLGASEFMVLKACVDLLMIQHGSDDVLSITALEGRDDPDDLDIVGYLARPVLLRTDIRSGRQLSFADLVARVRDDVLSVLDHPTLRLEAVLTQTAAIRDSTYTPLQQLMVSVVASPGVTDVEGLRFAPRSLRLPTSKTELELTVEMSPTSVQIVVTGREDLFDEETLHRLGRRFETLLDRVCRAPHLTLDELIGPDPDEVSWLEEQNRTGTDWPRERTLHEMVEDQVRRNPDATAVIGDRRWSYRELEAAANQVAQRVSHLSAGTRVGVAMNRRPELLAVLLGLFKAGLCLVPLDPAVPLPRVAQMVADADVGHVLLDPPGRAAFAELELAELTVWPTGRADTAEDPGPPSGREVTSRSLGYILFTSGSTGGPKGVLLRHDGLVNLAVWAVTELGTHRFRRVPLLSAMTFDVCMFEIFTAWLSGGAVVLAEDGLSLPRAPGVDETTIVVAVPSVHAEMLRLGAHPTSASTIISNGEVLPPTVLAELAGLPHVEQVYNMYAPTETTTFSLFTPVRPGEPIPLGRPMANTTAWVLRPDLALVPPGVVGELYIGGAGVSAGYLNRPELTAQRFRPDPFSDQPDAYLYATGDLVRHLADGRIMFVGRADHQVKLRGARIELGEVEATLLSHADVDDACAVVLRSPEGDSLAALVSGRTAEVACGDDDLRAHVRGLLPGYMVPDLVLAVRSVPTLSSGKLDRRSVESLLVQEVGRRRARVVPAAPSGPVAQRLLDLWGRVLGHRAGPDQTFFDAGGTSLLLVHLRETIREELAIDIPVTDLFEHPSVTRLAQHLERSTTMTTTGREAEGSSRGARRRAARELRGRRDGGTT